MILTPLQINELIEIIKNLHWVFVNETIGSKYIPEGVFDTLKKYGVKKSKVTSVPEYAFHYGILSSAWADPIELINLCTNALGNQFQTQQARTVVQRQFSEVWKPSPQVTVRFPNNDFKVYRYNAVLDPLVTALLGAFDTRNRIIGELS